MNRSLAFTFAAMMIGSVAADGFFTNANPIAREGPPLCVVTLAYSPREPQGVEVRVEGRNPMTRCTPYLDRVAVSSAALRLVIERQ